ncbi:MAG: type I methionyl aminopeptidase [Candidatus Pacebacteria bacterium]|nr:type I methionyl aminopeptidase [Candidatus Paceibacterota bacterium]
MYQFYSKEEREVLREGGKKLAWILKQLENFLHVGLGVSNIEKKSLELIEEVGATPATVGYAPSGASYPFPSAVCTSINNEVAHGISKNNKYRLKDGDVVSLDIVIKYKGLFVDICRTYGVGKMSKKDLELIATAKEVTREAVLQAKIGNTTEDIGGTAEKVAREFNFDTVKELGGHGVGRKIHDKPFIPNGKNLGVPVVKIEEGMVLAIEPIVCEGDWGIKIAKDDYLFLTKDGKKTAQFENTILVTKNGPEILTKL